MNAWQRVKKVIKKMNDNATLTDVYNSTMYLFSADEKYSISVNVTAIPMHWERGYFVNLKNKEILYSRIRDFYDIWTINHECQWKYFKLVPIFRLGRLHINYDTFAFYQLLSSCKAFYREITFKKTNSTANSTVMLIETLW